MKRLYLFDFDGTLTNKDTMFDFLQFSFPKNYTTAFIQFVPIFLLTKFKILKAEKAKQKFIAHFLKGKTKDEIEILSNNYFEYRKDSIFRKRALSYVKDLAHEENKYIVTASLDIWVKPFAKYLGVRLISTQAEFVNDVFTGNFATPNCNYKQKVARIIGEIQLSQFKEVYAFGDTNGDKFMLKLATNPHFKYFE
ncbi:HAD-IB family hydrolase [Apibacter sp. HY039]|uniref:HAD-IB family hydrolase n=1 Tax=Apibacter sp. HY039 TaxID=2501476 RepID=UPI000FEB72F0|nr:HAD-IB family hydrolase [Apibacter sp. HY039]